MKQKKISREEYAKLYCTEKRIRDRRVLYVNAETHRKIRFISNLFRSEHTTAASLVDAIILHHIEQHRDLLEELIQSEGLEPLIKTVYDDCEEEENTSEDEEKDESELNGNF